MALYENRFNKEKQKTRVGNATKKKVFMSTSSRVKSDTDKIPCSLFAKGAMLFFCYISVHKKPHKVKVHIATVAPEFNVTPWPKQKSAKNRAQNSVQSISSLKITQGQNVPLKSNSILVKYNKINSIK